jgi:hypothetical protein
MATASSTEAYLREHRSPVHGATINTLSSRGGKINNKAKLAWLVGFGDKAHWADMHNMAECCWN